MIDEICNRNWKGNYTVNGFTFGFLDRPDFRYSGESVASDVRVARLLEHPAMCRYIYKTGVAVTCPATRMLFNTFRNMTSGTLRDSDVPHEDTGRLIRGLSYVTIKHVHLPERWSDLLFGGKMYTNSTSARNKALWQKSYIESLSLK